MKKMGGIVCDGCRKTIPTGLRPVSVISKTGKTLHFHENVECQEKYNKPKPRKKFDPSTLIRDDQAAEFITESNGIEAIDIPFPAAVMGWLKKQHEAPEIAGQVSALNYTLKNYKKDLNIDMVVRLHRNLMKGLLPPWYLGIRRDWVRVGGRLCPPPAGIRPLLQKWCDKVNAMKNPTEDEIWQTHLAYEFIHPFIDGNGRSGRLLWLWLRYKFGFSYKCVYNATKFDFYYPQFDTFNWEIWLAS
jgi:Fic family protein